MPAVGIKVMLAWERWIPSVERRDFDKSVKYLKEANNRLELKAAEFFLLRLYAEPERMTKGHTCSRYGSNQHLSLSSVETKGSIIDGGGTGKPFKGKESLLIQL